MGFHEAFSLINEKKEDKHINWEIAYELWIIYGFYKENIKFSELNNFYWVQWFFWGGILYLMDLWMKWEVGIVVTQKPYLLGQVIAVYAILNQDIYISWPQTSITYSIQNVSTVFIKPI